MDIVTFKYNSRSLNTKALIDKLLYTYFILLMAIETINGFAVYKGLFFINDLVVAGKLFISLLSFAFIAMTSEKMLSRAMMLISIIFTLIFFHHLLSFDEDLRTVNVALKIFFNFFSVYYILHILSDWDDGYKNVKRIILINFCVITFNVYLGGAGVGFENYKAADDTAIGGTGYLAAGNEVSIALLLAYSAMLIFYKHSPLKLALIIAVASIASLLVLSKVTLLGISLVTIVFFFFLNKSLFMLFIAVASTSLLLTYSSWIVYFQLAINRWTYLIRSYGIEAFILGGNKRVTYIGDYLETLADKPIILLTGVGWTGRPENNLFDLVEAFGFTGLILFFLWSYILLKPSHFLFSNFNSNVDKAAFKTNAITGFMALTITLIAGHAIQSSMIAPFVACFYASSSLFIQSNANNSRVTSKRSLK